MDNWTKKDVSKTVSVESLLNKDLCSDNELFVRLAYTLRDCRNELCKACGAYNFMYSAKCELCKWQSGGKWEMICENALLRSK